MHGWLGTIGAHVVAGHCLHAPLGREFHALPWQAGKSWFQWVMGLEPTRANRARWVELVRGELAASLLLEGPTPETTDLIRKRWAVSS
jgi:hypothetical protein